MKRPLATVGFTLFLALISLCLINNAWLTVVIGASMLMLFTLSLINKKLKQAVWLRTVFVTVFAACLIFIAAEVYDYYPSIALAQENTQITAQVTDYPTFNGKRYYVNAKLCCDNGKKAKVRLSFAADSKYDESADEIIEKLKPGDILNFKGTVYVLGGNNSKIHRSFKSNGVYIGAYPTGKLNVSKHNTKSFLYALKHERQKVINQLLSSFDSDTSGVLISVLIGDTEFLTDWIYSNFKTAGVAHLMAVSGLHLSVWVLFIMGVIDKSGLDRRKFALLLILFVVIIMTFACFSKSVMRAGIMMIMYLFGFILRKTPDSLNSLGFSAIVILILNPYSCMNVGFLLSFLSTLAIITFSAPLSAQLIKRFKKLDGRKILYKVITAVMQSVTISVGVLIYTFPVMLISFGSISLVSAITNVLFLPVTMPLIVCSGLYVMLYFVPVLSDALHFISSAAVWYCTKVTQLISSLPYASVDIPEPFIPLLLVLFSVFAAGALILYKRTRKT